MAAISVHLLNTFITCPLGVWDPSAINAQMEHREILKKVIEK